MEWMQIENRGDLKQYKVGGSDYANVSEGSDKGKTFYCVCPYGKPVKFVNSRAEVEAYLTK